MYIWGTGYSTSTIANFMTAFQTISPCNFIFKIAFKFGSPQIQIETAFITFSYGHNGLVNIRKNTRYSVISHLYLISFVLSCI